MSNINNKLKILSLIAKELNDAEITWALGGSILLYLNGYTTKFDDIDTEIKEEDVFTAKEILLKHGYLEINEKNFDFNTKYFFEFKIHNVDIDIMAGLCIVANGKKILLSTIRN